MAGHSEVDCSLVRGADKDDLVVTSRTQQLGRVKSVRHPYPACTNALQLGCAENGAPENGGPDLG